MSDRIFYPFALLIAAALIVAALTWPRGTGAPEPGLPWISSPAPAPVTSSTSAS